EPMNDVDLGRLVEEVVERARRRTGREVTLDICDAATITARSAAVDRAVWNLLDNANKFSPPGAPVAVRVTGKRIEVEDRGPGIAPADREHVFDRFYRAPEARTAPGSGLGLSIVKQIADLHNATIEIDDRPGGGTIIAINFP